jgi:hypothetical protein
MLENILFILAVIVASYFVFATISAILYIRGTINNQRVMDIIANILIALFLIFMFLFITVAIIAFYEGR